jgi:uncharacterized membrane protein YkoI
MKTLIGMIAMMTVAAGLPAGAGDCPKEVKAAAEKAHAGAKIGACHEEREDGSTLYEVALRTSDGKQLEVEISPDGAIVETEEIVSADALPAAVLKTVQKEHPGGKVGKVERITAADGAVSYEVVVTSGGRSQELTLSAAGVIEEIEEADADDEDDEASK